MATPSGYEGSMLLDPNARKGFKTAIENIINFRGIGQKPDKFKFGQQTAKPIVNKPAVVPAPTSKPVPAPTSKPVPAPTSKPVSAPTSKPVPAPTTQPTTAEQVAAAQKAQGIDWTKIRGVPNIDKTASNPTEVTSEGPTAAELEAMRQQSVAEQSAREEQVKQDIAGGALQDTINAAQSQNKMLDAQAAGAMAKIQSGGLGDMIIGQGMLKAIAQQKEANAQDNQGILGAQTASQKVLSDQKAQNAQALAQLLGVQTESSLTPAKINLLAAQAQQAQQAGNLASTQAQYLPQEIQGKLSAAEAAQQDKQLERQIKLIDTASKATELEQMKDPSKAGDVVKARTSVLAKLLKR